VKPINLTVEIDDRVIDKIRGLPAELRDELQVDLDTAGQLVAAEMLVAAPGGPTSNLKQSIKMDQESETSRWVGPHVAHGIYVELGTGPAAGRAPYFPNPANLESWVKFRGGISLRNTKLGSARRQGQMDEIRDRAWALARYLARVGTRAQPFVQPTAEKTAPRVAAILQGGVERVLAKAGFA
jgi:hypothetical protein